MGNKSPSLMAVKTAKAQEYILAHPDETKAQQARNIGCSTSLVAKVRAQLIMDGLLSPSRKERPAPPEPKAPKTPSKPKGLLDHEAMQAMADMIDSQTDGLSDEQIYERMLKQCISFAFNPTLHPDTRMSASQMWQKLRDQKKARDLGPGMPKTFEAAVGRLQEMMTVTGWKITIAALKKAFPELAEGPRAEVESIEPPDGASEASQPA